VPARASPSPACGASPVPNNVGLVREPDARATSRLYQTGTTKHVRGDGSFPRKQPRCRATALRNGANRKFNLDGREATGYDAAQDYLTKQAKRRRASSGLNGAGIPPTAGAAGGAGFVSASVAAVDFSGWVI